MDNQVAQNLASLPPAMALFIAGVAAGVEIREICSGAANAEAAKTEATK